MKIKLFLFLACCLTARAQVGSYNARTTWMGPTVQFNIVGTPPPTLLTPQDQLRQIDGLVWKVVGEDVTNGWVQFSGKIMDVHADGVRIQGNYTGFYPSEDNSDYFVANFPFQVAEGDFIGIDRKAKTFMCAKVAGVYNYTTVMGASRTIRKLDYGEIYVPPPPSPEQVAAQNAARKVAEEKRKKATEANTIKWLQGQADGGDAYSQMRLGERYLKGDGVEKDEVKARDYLTKASWQGNQSAKDLLAKLEAKK